MEILNDEALIDAYCNARELNLNSDFLRLLENEMKRREIDIAEILMLER